MIGSGVLLIIFAMALLAPFLAPNDPYTQDLSRRLVTPIWHANGTWEHPLGTDAFGRDYLSRIMYGAQVSLLIGFGAMAISCVIGTAMGIAAGYFGGRVDMIIPLFGTTPLAIPAIPVALPCVALDGRSPQIGVQRLGLANWDR